MSEYHGHRSMQEALDCTDRAGKSWLAHLPTDEEQAAVTEMVNRLPRKLLDALPLGWQEALSNVVQIQNDLERAHRHVWAGGGIESPDHVRWLLRIEARMERIADRHQKDVGPGGMTSGDCSECGWSWPCPTYVWATDDTRDPIIATWDPNDDEDGSES